MVHSYSRIHYILCRLNLALQQENKKFVCVRIKFLANVALITLSDRINIQMARNLFLLVSVFSIANADSTLSYLYVDTFIFLYLSFSLCFFFLLFSFCFVCNESIENHCTYNYIASS